MNSACYVGHSVTPWHICTYPRKKHTAMADTLRRLTAASKLNVFLYFRRNSMKNSSTSSNQKLSPLKLLLDELRDAEPNAPISVQQGRVLAAALCNLQNALVKFMDVADANQEIANQNNQRIGDNFMSLGNAIQQIGDAIGLPVEFSRVDEPVESVEGTTENVVPFPTNTTKH